MATLVAGALAPLRGRAESSDGELVAAVRAGDDDAFERLYRRYHRRIAAYVYGMCRDHARAEDLTQDVFMSALRRMRETDRPIAFKPWIYEIAKNACIDAFRRSRRAEEVSYDAEGGLLPADHGRLVSTGPLPDVAVDHKLQLDHLRGAFGGLSESHHQILVMRELEGLSYREIGERLGMSRPSVESTLFRARRRLSEEYDELVTGERCVRVHAIIDEAAGGALGTRDQRKVARHLSHCQPCRRHARMAGVDAGVAARRPVRERIAALLPLPAFLRRRWLPPSDDGGAASAAAHGPALAQLSSAAAQYGEGSLAGWAKAATAAVAVAAAGVGAGSAAPDSGARFAGALPRDAVVRQAAVPRPAAAAAPARPAFAGTPAPTGAVRHRRTTTGPAGTAPAAGGPAGASPSSPAGAGAAPAAPRTAAPTPGTGSGTTTTAPAARLVDPKLPVPGGSSGSGSGSGSAGSGGPAGDAGSAGGVLQSLLPAAPSAPAATEPSAGSAPPPPAPSVSSVTAPVGDTVGGQVGDTVKDTGAAVDSAVSGTAGSVLGGGG